MKRRMLVYAPILLALPFLLALGPGGRNLLKNSDFETFTGNEPNGWETTNIPKALTVVSPSPKSHSGKYGVKCEVKDLFGSKMAGLIHQKGIDVPAGSLSLKGYYTLNSLGKDAGFIVLDFRSAEGSTVKLLELNFRESRLEYTPFVLNVDSPPNAVHVEVKCTLLPGEGSEKLHEGSYLLLDDMQLVASLPPDQKPVP